MKRIFDAMVLDSETLTKLIQTAIIATVAIALFFGLKGRILAFARRANLPRLALAQAVDLEQQLRETAPRGGELATAAIPK